MSFDPPDLRPARKLFHKNGQREFSNFLTGHTGARRKFLSDFKGLLRFFRVLQAVILRAGLSPSFYSWQRELPRRQKYYR